MNNIEELNKVTVRYFKEFELKQLVKFKLHENLDAIASGKNLEEIVFNLIDWADRKGKLLELVKALCQARPQIQEFKKIKEVWQIEEPIIAPGEVERRPQQEQQAQKRKQQQQLEKWQQLFTRRRFLKWGGLGSGGLAIAFLAREYFNSSPKPLEKSNFEVVTVNSQGKIINRRREEAKFFTEDLGNDVTLEMVSIPGGSFKMGSPSGEKQRRDSEEPQHTVNLPAFFMGKFKVTQEQYQQVMGQNPSYFKGNKRPVEKVSWNDAVEFCQKLSERRQQK